jgi:hypothetical protein
MKDTPTMGDNSKSRYEQCKDDLDRLNEIKEEKKALTKESNDIIDRLEKEGGVNRGALAEIRRMLDLSPAAIAAREESRKELFDWLVTPKLVEAETGEADE